MYYEHTNKINTLTGKVRPPIMPRKSILSLSILPEVLTKNEVTNGYIIEGLGILVYSSLDILATVFLCVLYLQVVMQLLVSTAWTASLSVRTATDLGE